MLSYSIIGLGKLGTSIAAAIASRGYHVVGVDVNPETVDALNEGKTIIRETGIKELIATNRDRLHATSSHREAILKTDLTFVIVPTPTDESGGFSLEYAGLAFGEIGEALREKNSYHLVGLTSTVLPGSTQYGLLPILEQRSGKKCGPDFGLCYSPTFVALGSVIRDFLRPDFTLIGEFDERSGEILQGAYADIMPCNPECRRMTLENAELTKISINTYVTMKITFANVLADICERIPGGDVDIVTAAIGLDTRVGSKYLTGAVSYGGPCFPRDNQAFGYMAKTLGGHAELSKSTDSINRVLGASVMDRIRDTITPGTTVAVLGLAYKPFSDVIEASQGILLAKSLSRHGVRVVAHDPLATQPATNELRDHAIVLKSLDDCLNQASVFIVVTADPAYATLEAKDFTSAGRPVTVIDCWRILSKKLVDKPGIMYVPIGRSSHDAVNKTRLAALWSSVFSHP